MKQSAKTLSRNFIPGVLLFLTISFISGCIFPEKDKTALKTTKNIDNEYFFKYRSLIKNIKNLQPGKKTPSLTAFILAEYHYLRGDHKKAAEYLSDIFISDNSDAAMAGLFIFRDMYLGRDSIDKLVYTEPGFTDAAAETAFNLERLHWASATGQQEKLSSIQEKTGIVNKFSLFQSTKVTGYHSVNIKDQIEKQYVKNKLSFPDDTTTISLASSEYEINLGRFSGNKKSSGIFLFTSFSTSETGYYNIMTNIPYPFKMYINGKDVFHRQNHEKNNGVFTENMLCELSKGTHTILLKITSYEEADEKISVFIKPSRKSKKPVFNSSLRKHSGNLNYFGFDHMKTNSNNRDDLLSRYILLKRDSFLYDNIQLDHIKDFYTEVSASVSPGLVYMLAIEYLNENRALSQKLLSFLSERYPEFMLPLSSLADVFMENMQYEKAEKTLQKMEKFHKENNNLLPMLKKADLYYFREWRKKELETVEKLASNYPSIPTAILYHAGIFESMGNIKKAIFIKESFLKLFPYYLPLLAQLEKDYRRTGDISGEIKILEKRKKIEPSNNEITKRLGYALYKKMDFKHAEKYLQKAYSRDVSDEKLAVKLADTFIFLNKEEKALEVLRKAHKNIPDSSAITSRMAMFRENNIGKMLSKFMMSEKKVKDKISEALENNDETSGNTLVILDEGVQNVYYNGYIYSRFRMVSLLKNREAVRNHVRTSIGNGTVVNARIIKKDGSEVKNWETDLNEIIFHGLEPGDVVWYTLDMVYEHYNWLNGFDFSWVFAIENSNVRHSIISVIVPEDMKINFHASKRVARKEKNHENKKVFVFEKKDIFLPPEEPMMRPLDDFKPKMSYSAVNSWQDFAEWFISFIHEQTSDSETLEKKARQIAKNSKSSQEIVRNIRNYVANKINYLYDDKGIYKVKPEQTSKTFMRKSGDCKDKTLLLQHMLHAAGIKSYYTLARSRNAGFFIKELPYMQFNHSLLYIPKQKNMKSGFFVDATSEYDNYRGINPELEGTVAFVLWHDTGKWEFKKIESRQKSSMEYTSKSSSSSSEEKAKIIFRGSAASYARYRHARDGSFDDYLSELVNRISHRPVEIKDIYTEGPVSSEPLILKTKTSPFFPVNVSSTFSSIVARENRNYPLQLFKNIQKYSFSFHCPGKKLGEFEKINRFFRYEIKNNNDNCTVLFELKQKEISPEEYSYFRESIIDIISIENRYRGLF